MLYICIHDRANKIRDNYRFLVAYILLRHLLQKRIHTKPARSTNLQRPNYTEFQNLTITWRLHYSRKKAHGRHADAKDKAIPLQAWTGPEGSWRVRQSAHELGKVVSPTHRPPLPPGNIPGTHFCKGLSQPQGHSAAGRIMSMKFSNETFENRTRDLPACRAVPQPSASPAACPAMLMLPTVNRVILGRVDR